MGYPRTNPRWSPKRQLLANILYVVYGGRRLVKTGKHRFLVLDYEAGLPKLRSLARTAAKLGWADIEEHDDGIAFCIRDTHPDFRETA